VRKAVQETASFDLLYLENQVSVSATGSCGNDIFIEGKGNKDDDDQKIDHRTDGTHRFRTASW
jgi:hypothetical protein